jgi:hypothetical protein
MIDAKLSKLVEFYGKKLDVHREVDSDFNRGACVAYSIAKLMTEQVVFDLLDKQLSDSIKKDDDLEFE